MALFPVNKPSWERKHCFFKLKTTTLELVGEDYSVPDIMCLLWDELQIDTSATHHETEQAAARVSGVMCNITYCVPVCCLYSEGCVMPWKDLDGVDERPGDLIYCRLCFDINVPYFGSCIKHAGSTSLIY